MELKIPEYIQNYIDGGFYAPISRNYIDNINPATGEVISQIPESNEKDITQAVAAAKKAFPLWTVTLLEKRFEVLHRIAELIDANLDALSLTES